MNVLHNIASVFSSPAKSLPVKTPAKKRNYGDMSTTRSAEKRNRGSYDPREYQSAVYNGAGTMTGTREEDDDGEEVEEEEEEEEEEGAAEQLLHEQLHAEDERRYARPTTTPKSVCGSTRALSSALKTPSRSEGAFRQAVASNDMLAETEAMLAKKPDGEAKRKKLAIIERARTRNDEITSKAEVGVYMAAQARERRTRVEQTPVTRSAVGNVVVGEVESGSEEEHIVSPATPQHRLYTVHEEPTSTIQLSPTIVDASQLKHTPGTKRPRTRLASSATKHSTTKHPTVKSTSTSTPTSTPAPRTIESHTNPNGSKLPDSDSNSDFKLPDNMSYPCGWHTLTPSQKWLTDPNLRARELSSKPEAIRSELHDEPEYALRDAEMRDGLWALMSGMEKFAQTWFPSGAHARYTTQDRQGDTVVEKQFFQRLTPETARVVACVASGGPGGVWGWHDLFVDGDKVRALVCGILGNVLSEQVFQHVFFGGTQDGVRAVRHVEAKGRHGDGFDRKAKYAATIRVYLATPTSLPANFNAHVNVIVGALWTHLEPLLDLVHPPPPPSSSSSSSSSAPTLANIFPTLHRLVTQAALLSLSMSLDPHTVYHHVPLFKEDNYTSSTMECFNDASMRQRNMRTADSAVEAEEQDRRRSFSASEKKRAHGDTALTQIVCLEGVTAYRKGGWEDGMSDIRHVGEGRGVVFEKREYADMGVRARILSHGWVYCRWGRARSMHASASLDEKSGKRIHGGAWREGGFVNFADVEGVVDWLDMERAEREKRIKEKQVGMVLEMLDEKKRQHDDLAEQLRKAKAVRPTYLESLGDPDL